jgi:type III pantothenate kinase
MYDWLALAIGNSHCHWAWFQANQLQVAWDTPHLNEATTQQLITSQFDFAQVQLAPQGIDLPRWYQPLPLRIASVVPTQTRLWQQYEPGHLLTLVNIPLKNCYPTLGIDRALALWGAIQTYGAPVLVIDGGTALTFTGADGLPQLIGGAILPGIRPLFQTLHQTTAALPEMPQSTRLSTRLPDRWARNTAEAIRSGIIHTVTAGLVQFIADWRADYPHSPIVFTGGDGAQLLAWWEAASGANSNRGAQTVWDVQLIFAGIKAVAPPDYPTAHKS